MTRTLLATVLTLPLALASPVWGRIAGGGPTNTDCYVEWDSVTATSPSKPFTVSCQDGDPNCDADTTTGQCTFVVNVCAFQGDVPGCNPLPITKLNMSKTLTVAGKSKYVTSVLTPPSRLDASSCGTAAQIVLPLKGRAPRLKPRTIKFKMTAITAGQRNLKRDIDKLVLQCRPCENCGVCPPNPAGGPNEYSFQIQQQGADLDNGWTGANHNSPPVFGTKLRVCMKDCDASGSQPCTQNDGTDGNATNNVNGLTFGAPLPLIANGVAVCVVNRYGTPKASGGMVNVATGDTQVTVNLLADVYLSSQSQLCPRCSGQNLGDHGKCDSGPNAGLDCTTEGLVTVPPVTPSRFALSSRCPPAGRPQGTLIIPLGLTTGASTLAGPKPCGESSDDDCGAQGPCNGPCTGPPPGGTCASMLNGQCVDGRGGISQFCCAGNGNKACYPTSTASGIGQIVRNGVVNVPTPALPDPTYPKCGTATLASTFCEPATQQSTLINGTTGLPGPGAALFPITWGVKTQGGTSCP